MARRIAPIVLALLVLMGCAGPSKLAQRSEAKLAGGETGRAFELAVRALDKEPGNARARAAATAAGNSMARDREQRIHALAQSDSLAAAESVLELAAFRLNANHYAAITVDPAWAREEQALRRTAALTCYRRGSVDLESHRPKRAWLHFADARRFVPDFREAAKEADRARVQALDRVAVIPFATVSASARLGREVAAQWRDALARGLMPPDAHFTRLLGSAAVEQQMKVSQQGHLSREEAIRLGRKAGAERVVWGSIGEVESHTQLHLFRNTIAHHVVAQDPGGVTVARWEEVPVDMISRVRTVTVDVDYEVIATTGGTTLAHQHAQRSASARVVWTTYVPEGDLGSYALVSDPVRATDPERATDVEGRWKEACGESATLRQVLDAIRAVRHTDHYDRGALPRFMTGAAFVFLKDLPPANDLAFAALSGGWEPLRADLQRLDTVDDVDLGMAATDEAGH